MAKKQSTKATHGRRKVSPKMDNPKCKNRSMSAVAKYLSRCDVEGMSIGYEELDIEFIEMLDERDGIYHTYHAKDKKAPRTKSRRYWARPYRRTPHLPLRTCTKHQVQHYTGCMICAQEKFSGVEKIQPTQMWRVAQVQFAKVVERQGMKEAYANL
jgi:hypothetical protein